MSKKILTLIALLIPELISAYTISGKVIDSEKEPMTGASIALYKDSVTIVGSASADIAGVFRLMSDIKGNLSVRISMVGSVPSNIQFESSGNNIDLGIITLASSPTMLGEIVVEAQNVVEKGSNYIVLPTEKEIKQSGTSIDLLENLQYKLPGLQVNSSLDKVTIENGAAIFQINGRIVDYSRIQSLNNDNILRIEYSNVSDIKYGTSVMGVINFVTKPVAKGGSLLINALGGVGYTNGNIGTTFNYGKSEWTLDYGNYWRDFDKVYDTGTESFIGRDMPIVRHRLPVASNLDRLKNNLSIGYTYMHNQATMFAVTLSGKTSDTQQGTNNFVRQLYGEEVQQEYSYTSVNDNENFTPGLDLYFRRQLDKTSKLELNAYGSLSTGDYGTALDYESLTNLYNQCSNTDNTSWRAGGEALYTKSYGKFETKYGVNYYHNYAENLYAENEGELQVSEQNNDNLYVHGSITGRIDKFTYSAGVGGRYYQTDNGNLNQNSFKFNSKVTLNYKINSKLSLNYLFMLDPTMPTLSAQSEVVQRIDDISYRVGNPDLKPSTYLRNRIFIRYATTKLNLSFWAAHSRDIDPIYNRYSYISDKSSRYYNMFMTQSCNANHDDLINFELQAGYTGIKNLMIYGVAGWDRYTFSGFGNINPFENFYANLSASYAIKNWRFSGRVELKPRYSLSGSIMKTPERCNVIMAQYRWRNFWFTAGLMNPFSKRGVLYKTKEMSNVHHLNSDFYVKDAANMIVLGVTYRVNFGDKFKKAKQTLQNNGIDSGRESNEKLSDNQY